jgi:hypothetical protein
MVQPDSLLTLSHLEAAIPVPWLRSQPISRIIGCLILISWFLLSAFANFATVRVNAAAELDWE